MQAPPIDKLMDKIHSMYKLVILSSRRTIELADGAQKLVNTPADAKPSDIAIEEIIEGKVSYKVMEGK